MQEPTVLEFSKKYDADHAAEYYRKHRAGLRRRVSNWWEQRMAARALEIAGNPASVLDLPCGAGRFWALLAGRQDRRLMAADYSADMVATARREQPPALVARFEAFQASAFETGLPDGAVESIFCMRLLHHIVEPADRLKLLREFHRVAQKSVIISLWVDGNLQASRRKRLEQRRRKRAYQNRFVAEPAVIEREMRECGFDIAGQVDMLPGISMWRTYVLIKR